MTFQCLFLKLKAINYSSCHREHVVAVDPIFAKWKKPLAKNDDNHGKILVDVELDSNFYLTFQFEEKTSFINF